jgi:hypothetical protein
MNNSVTTPYSLRAPSGGIHMQSGYSQPSKIRFRGMSPGEHTDDAAGMKQGNPAATFYFRFTWHVDLPSATDTRPAAHVIACADDVHIVGHILAVKTASTTLVSGHYCRLAKVLGRIFVMVQLCHSNDFGSL